MTNLIYGARAVYCGLCHKQPGACDCDVFLQAWERLLATDGATLYEWAGAGGVVRYVLTGDGSGTPLPAFDGTVDRVSLPTAPVAEEAPVEETQPAPSGWRDRPAML